MKILTLVLTLFMSLSAIAHEGHGEMPVEPAKYGGVLGNVVSEKKMKEKVKHNPALMKAEIVRSEDGMVRVYLYDLNMNAFKTESFSSEAKGTVENNRAKTNQNFTLKAHGDHYMGKMPKQKKKPYNVYLTFKKGSESYFVGFDNLD